MQNSCYSLTGGPWGRRTPSDMPGYFKWCDVCCLEPAGSFTAPPRTGHGLLSAVQGVEVLPKQSITSGGKMRGWIGAVSAKQHHCRAAIPAEQLPTCFSSRHAYFWFVNYFSLRDPFRCPLGRTGCISLCSAVVLVLYCVGNGDVTVSMKDLLH